MVVSHIARRVENRHFFILSMKILCAIKTFKYDSKSHMCEI